VVFHACECRTTTYELRPAAGQGFVHETTWMLSATARHTYEIRGHRR
jgi:hypothetical protein